MVVSVMVTVVVLVVSVMVTVVVLVGSVGNGDGGVGW